MRIVRSLVMAETSSNRGVSPVLVSVLDLYPRFASLSNSHASTAPEAPAWSNRIRATSQSFSVRAQSRSGFASPARVQTEVACTEGHQLKQSSHDRDVLQEVE